jgi:hypothetical protein
MFAMMTSAQVVSVLRVMLLDMEEHKRVGDRINASRQQLALGLQFQVGERRRYLIDETLMEVSRDDKGQYAFKPAGIEV